MSYKNFMAKITKNKKTLQKHRLLTKRMLLFLEHQSIFAKASTIGAYKVGLKHFSTFLSITFKTNKHLKSHISQLKRTHLEKYLLYVCNMNLAPYTKVNYLLNTKLYLTWEINHDNLNPEALDVLSRKNFPKVPEYLPRPLSTENDQILISRFRRSASPYAIFFLLLRLTGLRISELINLPWDCVITNDKNEKYLRVPPGKMDLERIIPLSDEAVNLVEKIRSFYPLALNKSDSSRLIGISGSTEVVRNRLSIHFKKIVNGLTDQNKPITFHRERHSYATSLLTAGVSIVALMKLLGHRRIEMSLRYAKVTPEHLRNEYMQAIRVIQNQVGLNEISQNNAVFLHPTEVIKQLYAFTNKAARLTPKQKHALLQRLDRLKKDLKLIVFDQKFESNLPLLED